LARDDGVNLRVLLGGADVDRLDPRVSQRAAQHGAIQHPRQPYVVDVVALPAHEARVLLALQAAVADRPFLCLGCFGGGHAQLSSPPVATSGCSAAQRIDLTMFW